MKRLLLVCLVFASFIAAASCGGSDSGGGGDASADTTAPPADGSPDTTAPPADGSPDTTAPPADGSPDTTAPPADGSPDTGSDSAPLADANDGAISDADAGIADADAGIADADAGIADADADAFDGAGISCSTIPNVGNIYYSRYPIPLPDGGPKTDGELWVVKGDGSSDVKLGVGAHPRLSPDGKRLMFLRDNANVINGNLYVRDLPTDGGAPVDTLVFANDDSVIGYDWRPDSTGIVFDYKCDIYSANPDGTGRQLLINYREADCYSDYPVISRTDGRIAFQNFYDGLDLAPSAGVGAAKIPNTFAGSDLGGPTHPLGDIWPAWTPDGQWLAFLKIAPASIYNPGKMGSVWKIKPDGSGLALVFTVDPGDGFFYGGTVTPDGVYYINVGLYQGVQAMYAVPLDGSRAIKRVCTSAGAAIDWVGSVTTP